MGRVERVERWVLGLLISIFAVAVYLTGNLGVAFVATFSSYIVEQMAARLDA